MTISRRSFFARVSGVAVAAPLVPLLKKTEKSATYRLVGNIHHELVASDFKLTTHSHTYTPYSGHESLDIPDSRIIGRRTA